MVLLEWDSRTDAEAIVCGLSPLLERNAMVHSFKLYGSSYVYIPYIFLSKVEQAANSEKGQKMQQGKTLRLRLYNTTKILL